MGEMISITSTYSKPVCSPEGMRDTEITNATIPSAEKMKIKLINIRNIHRHPYHASTFTQKKTINFIV